MSEVTVRADQAPLTDAATDGIIVSAYPNGLSPAAIGVDAALGGELGRMLASGALPTGFGAATVITTLGRIGARRVIVLGLGDPAVLDGFRLTNAYHLAGVAARTARLASLTVDIDPLARTAVAEPGLAARAVVCGLVLANIEPQHVDASAAQRPPITSVTVAGAGELSDDETSLAVALADATNTVRVLAATPANLLTPTVLAERTRAMCDGLANTEVTVIEREELERMGAGALLCIAQGSTEPPALITVRYRGGGEGGPVLGLVGKGITFDSGGISIKPAAGMEMMRFDMSGGAAVLAAIATIARLGLRCNVVAVVPATENMPSGSAVKPGDVVTSLDGTTIEVVNTDAEGRVVLADGLTQAIRLGATHLVDVATLTGAAIIALGHVTGALMSSDARLAERITRASEQVGERMHQLPLHPEYDVCLESEVADVCNFPGREAGTIAGGVFLRHFAAGRPWAHLDIAGSSWNSQGSLAKQIPKGPTGTPVRTLIELARQFADNPPAADR